MTTTTVKYLTKDQDCSEGSITYWFEVLGDERIEDGTYGICEQGPESTAVNSDNEPIDYSDVDARRVKSICVVTDEMRAA